jgi:sulfur-carrier protein
VRLVLPGALRELADGASELAVDLTGPTPVVRDVLDAVTAGRPILDARVRDETGALRRHVNVFVDGQDVRSGEGLDTAVAPGAVVHILPSVAGG